MNASRSGTQSEQSKQPSQPKYKGQCSCPQKPLKEEVERWRLPKIEGGEGLGHEKGATAEKQLRPVYVTARRSRCQIVPLCATGAARKIRQAVTRAPFTLGGVGENPNEKLKTKVFRTHASTEVPLVTRRKPVREFATARWLRPPGQSRKVTH